MGAGAGMGAGFSAAGGGSGAAFFAADFLATVFLVVFFATVFLAATFFTAAFLAAVLRAGFAAGSAGAISKRSSVVFLLIRLSVWGKGSVKSEGVLEEVIGGDVKIHREPWKGGRGRHRLPCR